MPLIVRGAVRGAVPLVLRGAVPLVLLSLLALVEGVAQHEGRRVNNKYHDDGQDSHAIQWIGDKKATSNHLVHANKWGRDPEVR